MSSHQRGSPPWFLEKIRGGKDLWKLKVERFREKLDFQGPPWRIIPGLGYVVNNHGDRKSPKWGYSPL